MDDLRAMQTAQLNVIADVFAIIFRNLPPRGAEEVREFLTILSGPPEAEEGPGPHFMQDVAETLLSAIEGYE